MKDITKEPIFYYVLVPLLLAIWPLWLFALGIPNAGAAYRREVGQYNNAEKLITQILEIDPQRLDYANAKTTDDAFDYTTAVDQVTKICGISPTAYKLSASPARKTKGGQQNQDASITIDRIDIASLAKFLSVMHMRWATLQCSNLTLSKIKGEKNAWKADIRFIYYQ
ncbi:MAG: hypothetical protein A2173_11540 [Planctomycetes bacterium RBG_13_44_8b]|nr:MAG: hypothetical protein A2173_11540 [Planctomycetes bacterium RBG_13_44_8b]